VACRRSRNLECLRKTSPLAHSVLCLTRLLSVEVLHSLHFNLGEDVLFIWPDLDPRSMLRKGQLMNPRAVIIAVILLSSFVSLAQEPYKSDATVNAATVNTKNRWGETGLTVAVEHRDLQKVRGLLKAGADPNVANTAGETVLMIASIRSTPEIVIELLHAGANPNVIEPQHGLTALSWAILSRRMDTVQALIRNGADVNFPSPQGKTPLMFAVGSEGNGFVEVLLEAGARVNDTNEDGISALAQAGWSCREGLVTLLQKADAQPSPSDWSKTRPPMLGDFPVKQIFKGSTAKLDLKSNRDGYMFKTRLQAAGTGHPNFAGHYIVAEWGCGSNCQSSMMIDAVDGKIYNGTVTDRGSIFRLSSNLMIADPPMTGGRAYDDDPVAHRGARYYVLRKNALHQIFAEPCKVESGRQTCGCPEVQKMIFGSTTNNHSGQ
jgi:hypothetical protein